MHKFVYWLESRRYDICNDRLKFSETTKKWIVQIFILVMSIFIKDTSSRLFFFNLK
jgi:hypothetical protein